SEANAHPLISAAEVAIVHNGIIENHEQFRDGLLKKGYVFTSETDTEVALHLIHSYLVDHDLLTAVRLASQQLEGAYALAVISTKDPNHLIAVRNGPPLVVGLGNNANFVASDTLALLQVTNKVMYLEDGDIADVRREGVNIYNADGQAVTRKVH